MKTALSNQLPAALRVLLQFALLMGLSEFGSRLVAYLDVPLPGGVKGVTGHLCQRLLRHMPMREVLS
jgi:putative effector of murein hydrolase LrgA (UPF0299 family)